VIRICKIQPQKFISSS